ncbi:hypothetical protein CVO96_18295 [Deinococcus koreensis]|uniref:O-antigen ligase-related domain-containing protein n=2 Tax=Deinococcus koreensis TaxID=2054903 RepID=A0A2K3UTT4_9DEIO|nr:hypothetical protein CVO96_18295 [Deinococcus koreensis]
MFGLMGVGVALGSSEQFKQITFGLAVVFVTAVAYSLSVGADIFTSRLGHPYMTSTTLGIAGAFGIWIALFTTGKLLWKIPFGILGMIIVLLSGSRGSFIAAVLGCIVGSFVYRNRRMNLVIIVGLGILAGTIYIGNRVNFIAIDRLNSVDTTGRDIVWYNTLTVIQSQPWAGVGSYRLGKYLSPSINDCTTFVGFDGRSAECSNIVTRLGNPWQIAHNGVLHQLAETGFVGLMGLTALLGYALFNAALRGDRLILSILIGIIFASINDNTLIVPSPFFAELFWIAVGIAIKNGEVFAFADLLIGFISVIILSTPILYNLSTSSRYSVVKLMYINAPKHVRIGNKYTVVSKFYLMPGQYRVVLFSCSTYCINAGVTNFTALSNNSDMIFVSGNILNEKSQLIRLRLYNLKSSWDINPVAEKIWKVDVE